MRPTGPTLSAFFHRWRMVEADFQELYGIDLREPGLLQARSLNWLQVRLWGLLSSRASRVRRDLYPDPKPPSARH